MQRARAGEVRAADDVPTGDAGLKEPPEYFNASRNG